MNLEKQQFKSKFKLDLDFKFNEFVLLLSYSKRFKFESQIKYNYKNDKPLFNHKLFLYLGMVYFKQLVE